MTNVHFLIFILLHPGDAGSFGSGTAGFFLRLNKKTKHQHHHLVLVSPSLYFQESCFNLNALCLNVPVCHAGRHGIFLEVGSTVSKPRQREENVELRFLNFQEECSLSMLRMGNTAITIILT